MDYNPGFESIDQNVQGFGHGSEYFKAYMLVLYAKLGSLICKIRFYICFSRKRRFWMLR